MKQERTDINLLLFLLLLFSASVGILHGRKKNKIQTKLLHLDVAREGSMADLLPEEIVIYLQPLVLARGIGVLAQTMHQFSIGKVYEVASIIMKDEQSMLTADEKLKFIFALALQYADNKKIYTKLFNLIIDNSQLLKDEPLLLVAARSKYKEVIPMLLAWSKQRPTQKRTLYIHEQPFSKALMQNALDVAIIQDDLEVLEVLYSYGVKISSLDASSLLWHVVEKNKNTNFVPFLVKRGADINYVGPDGYTLLMKAVAQNNIVMVQTLLNNRADIDILVDPKIGTAKQIATIKKLESVKKMLDAYLMKS